MGRFKVSTGHRYNNSLTRLGVNLSPHSECGRQPVVLADPIDVGRLRGNLSLKGQQSIAQLIKSRYSTEGGIGIESGGF